MAYIGTQPLAGQYRKLDDISSGFNGATTSFTTSVGGTNVTAGSPQQLLVSLGGVIQQPTVDYTVNTSTITFTTAPASGLSFFAVLMGDALNTSVPADGSITSAKLAGSLSVGLAAGSASTPSLFFTGDTNTGIYSPGADQVAISTGGTGRITIDGSGNVNIDSNTLYVDATNNRVGIGTTSPGYLLTVSGGATSFAANQYVRFGAGLFASGDGSTDNYLFTGTGGLSIRNATDTSTLVKVDNSGRLLVGTSSARDFFGGTDTPALQVEGLGNAGRELSVTSSTASGSGGVVLLAKQRSGAVGGQTIVQSGDQLGYLGFQGSDGTKMLPGAAIEATVDGTPGVNDLPTRLVFSTTADAASSPTQRLVIASNGDHRFNNSADVHPGTDNATRLGFSGGRWSAVWAVNGTIQTSDQRAKSNINDSTLGSDFIKSLRPVSYKWIEGGKRDTGERDKDGNWIYESVPGERTHWGFIAQEVKQVVDAAGVDFGGWVLTDKDDPDSQQALRYDQFIAPLTKALQEALAEIDVLKAKVAALESKP